MDETSPNLRITYDPTPTFSTLCQFFLFIAKITDRIGIMNREKLLVKFYIKIVLLIILLVFTGLEQMAIRNCEDS